MIRALLLALPLMWIFEARAQVQTPDLAKFHQRFQLVRATDGKLVAIRLRHLTPFSLRPYLQQLKDDLHAEQGRLRAVSAEELGAQIDQELFEMGINPYDKSGDGTAWLIRQSLVNIPNIPVETSFTKAGQRNLIGEFEAQIAQEMRNYDLAVVAHLRDPRYFYHRAVTYRVVRWALKEAKKRFREIPILNLVSYVVVKAHGLMMEQKTLHQAMLLHYLHALPPEALGLSAEEVDLTLSSIYEYRISVGDIRDSDYAANNWVSFGRQKFNRQVATADTRARWLPQRFPWGSMSRLNHAFTQVNGQTTEKIWHLLADEHKWTDKAALAYDAQNPHQLRRDRTLLNLAELGIGFLPYVPGWLKDLAEDYLTSRHTKQRGLEGALIPFFEMRGEAEVARILQAQILNPFILWP